ncbi:MAG: GntR family transcriptional regulator [Thermobacillus sp. ZCTH02-B1]|uniref:GntR family transcriptional regulator n=1 Tax=Thermobacillus sp. ZCTH02-B1 TaxID=1858795 RepID=UPI000B56A5C4|nr:GntR family transcriptional regulator [Thermobacillus sp. ZCTH02-B1]OUM94210.1 MAG: GntR family transcriptional regulator [Thermobacillus sp. ZCTH02-B1]
MNAPLNKVDPNSPIPLYQQLKNILKRKIISEEWPVGTIIPTEKELIEAYEVSRTTVREAIAELVNQGLLQKKQGKGTIVISTRVEERLGRLTGFAEEIGDKGLEHSARLLSAEFQRNRFYELSQLGLDENATVFLVDRIRFVDKQPVAYERSCWPEDIGRLLVNEDLNTVAFYKVLEEKYGIELKEATDTISAVNATKYEAELLGITPGDALLERRRISCDISGRPVEFTRTKYRNDKYSYKVKLLR